MTTDCNVFAPVTLLPKVTVISLPILVKKVQYKIKLDVDSTEKPVQIIVENAYRPL